MRNIIIEKKSKEIIEGKYYGQAFQIDLALKKDCYHILTDDEVQEVIEDFKSQKEDNQMLSLEIGSKVRVMIEEGHCLIEYDLKVDSIEEEGVDDEGNYYCVAFGIGITEEDEEMAEEYTHRIDSMCFGKIIS